MGMLAVQAIVSLMLNPPEGPPREIAQQSVEVWTGVG